MLILPVRPLPTALRIQENPDPRAISSSPSSIAKPDPELHLGQRPPSQQTGTMISIMPSPKPPSPKRPKLSLQTLAAVSATEKSKTILTLGSGTDTPVRHKIYVNAFTSSQSSTSCGHQIQEDSSQTYSADDQITPPSSTASSAISSSSAHTSPFPLSAPYSLPIGSRSILRNSPLPRKHLSVASTRINRIMFPPVKRVMFREILEDIIPAQMFGHSPDSSDSDCSEKRPRATFENVEMKERQSAGNVNVDAPWTPVHRRRKRRREWVWRPLDDDVFAVHQILDDQIGCQCEKKVNLPSADDDKPVKVENNLPAISEIACLRSTIELSYEQKDAMAKGTLIS